MAAAQPRTLQDMKAANDAGAYAGHYLEVRVDNNRVWATLWQDETPDWGAEEEPEKLWDFELPTCGMALIVDLLKTLGFQNSARV